MSNNQELVLERFVVRLDKHGKWHYVPTDDVFFTLCGAYIPPSPNERNLIGKKALHHKSKILCKSCRSRAEKHALKGKVRLANLGESRGNALD
jgi:hypothetical protein